MKISEWWQDNAKYVKAWTSYMLLVFACQTVVGILNLRSAVAAPLRALGFAESAALWISAIFFSLVFAVLGFFVFRAAVRKFIVQGPE